MTDSDENNEYRILPLNNNDPNSETYDRKNFYLDRVQIMITHGQLSCPGEKFLVLGDSYLMIRIRPNSPVPNGQTVR